MNFALIGATACLVAEISMWGIANAAAGHAAEQPPNAVTESEGITDLTRATPGFTYFNKIGADLQGQHADLADCNSIAGEGSSPPGPIAGGLIGAAIYASVLPGQTRGQTAANVENCMVARGWRVVRIPEPEGRELASAGSAELGMRLQAWVGSDAPHGEVVRAWRNDLATGSTVRFRIGGADNHVSLSEIVFGEAAATPTREPSTSLRRSTSPEVSELSPDRVSDAKLGVDQAIIVIGVHHTGVQAGIEVTLERYPASGVGGEKPVVLRALGRPFYRDSDRIFVVPSGTWRLSGFASADLTVSDCLGGPAFTVRPGDVVFAGTFNLGSDAVGPDMNLGLPAALLGKTPTLQSVLRPAPWTNGFTSRCQGTYFYAYEIAGAPTKEGYVRGHAPLSSIDADSASVP